MAVEEKERFASSAASIAAASSSSGRGATAMVMVVKNDCIANDTIILFVWRKARRGWR